MANSFLTKVLRQFSGEKCKGNLNKSCWDNWASIFRVNLDVYLTLHIKINSQWNMDLNGLNLDGTEFFGSFFLMSLAKNLTILSVFSKNQLLVSLIFSLLISILFLSSLILIVSFLLLTLGFICSYFSTSFKWQVRLFI